MKEDTPYLGKGWEFPVRFDKHRGVSMVCAEEDIRQSLQILFSTLPGERIFRFDYGCDLSAWVFAEINLTEKSSMENEIRRAILNGEPRIRVEKVTIEVEEGIANPLHPTGILRIELTYIIKETNSRSNMVYPFYFKEGTQL